jgi:hypothetical protein
MASPTSIELPLKIATWARRAVAGPQTIALVIAPGMGNGLDTSDAEIAAIADLTCAMRREMAGGAR